MSSSVFWNGAVGLAPQLSAPLHESNKAGLEGKRVVHVLPSVGKQFFFVLLRTKRDKWAPPAWVHPGKAARVGGPYQASHDMEAGTSWPEIACGFSRPYVGQVGGDGSSCSESVWTELSSWAAEIQAGDHCDPGQGWGRQA